MIETLERISNYSSTESSSRRYERHANVDNTIKKEDISKILDAFHEKISKFQNRINVRYEFNGKTWDAPLELKGIVDHLEQAKEILEYKEGWDDENASPTNEETFKKASDFLMQYSIYIYKYLGKGVLDTPYLSILKDGSISLEWETPKAVFTIIFEKENNPIHYFFAKQKVDHIPIRSGIPNNGFIIEERLAQWMKNYLA